MKASEYAIIENTYFLIEEKTKKKCLENGINFYNYLGEFSILLKNYIKNKNIIQTIKDLDFSDYIKARAVLNKRNIANKGHEICLAIEKFNKSKEMLFYWLDKTKEPYFFILNPIYKYGAGIDYNSWFCKRYVYIKENHTGTQNIDVAEDYFRYKINNF